MARSKEKDLPRRHVGRGDKARKARKRAKRVPGLERAWQDDVMTHQPAPETAPAPRPRRSGNVGFARALGVHRSHLRRVLKGERNSPGLLARYQEIREADARAKRGSQ